MQELQIKLLGEKEKKQNEYQKNRKLQEGDRKRVLF